MAKDTGLIIRRVQVRFLLPQPIYCAVEKWYLVSLINSILNRIAGSIPASARLMGVSPRWLRHDSDKVACGRSIRPTPTNYINGRMAERFMASVC